MSYIWIMVANSANARIFEAVNNNELTEVAGITHPESRMHGSDLVSERPGRAHESIGSSRHVIEPKTSPKDVEFENFANILAKILENAHNEGKFKKLYIAANPSFLGLLRQSIPSSVSHTIGAEFNVDMTQMEVGDIRKHLPYVL